MKSIDKLAKLLRTSEKVVLDLDKKMSKISGRSGIVEKIIRENEAKTRESLANLGFGRGKSFFNLQAEEIYQALINQVEASDRALLKHFHQPDLSTAVGCRSLIYAAKELTGYLPGFYLKQEKAKELLKLNPPQKIMEALGYGRDIDKLLEKEDVFEIFCALRFVEDGDWLNDIFFKPYRDLKKEDFEEREIRLMALPEKWRGIGQKFLGRKLHHMSHLKELGIVFVIPINKVNPGETIYQFFMTLHYTYEVDWHSKLFASYSQDKNFAQKMIQALKVKVSTDKLPNKDKMSWRLAPQYLAKKDPSDPRLKEPHISPEAWHYTQVAAVIKKFSQRFPEAGLSFWPGLDVVGDYFPDQDSESAFISFDLFDNGISFLRQKDFKNRFLYHQQEAFWNKVFNEYLGESALDKMMMENLDKGYLVL